MAQKKPLSTKYSREFLKKIPKTDLHVHLDGSLRIPTLIELAKELKVKLPSYTEEGLRALVFKPKYKDLVDYLQGFLYTAAVMQTPEALERVAYEFALDNFEEGVRYVEPRFAPQQHMNEKMTIEDVISSVDLGLDRARREINATAAIKKKAEPPFEYGIIGCAMRMFTKNFPGYYSQLMKIHSHLPEEELYDLASMDLVRALVHMRDEKGLPIAGFDLAGAEKGYPAVDHGRAYSFAHKNFLKKTVHAGEAYGPPSIFQAITDCYADRIGHGTHLFDEEMVELPTKHERSRYVQSLWEYIADRRITIEVCLKSNLQTLPRIKQVRDHPVGKMLDKRLSVSFCTDNRLVSNTTVTDEIELAVQNFDITPKRLRDLIVYGFKRSFFPREYPEKREYVRSVIDYYERIAAEMMGCTK